MADSKLSALPSGSAIVDTDLFYSDQSGTSVKQPSTALATYIGTKTSALLDTIGATQGDILFRDAGTWNVLAPGTSGFLLQTNGAAANPSWVTPPTAGAITVGVTTIAGGTDAHVVYQKPSGLFDEAANFTIDPTFGLPNVPNIGAYLYNLIPVIQGDTPRSNFWFAGAGNVTATGTNNLGDAPGALASVTTGNNNSAYGVGSLQAMTSGSANMAIGTNAMNNAISGSSNLAIGVSALGGAASTGTGNVALGPNALQNNTSGGGNMAMGTGAIQNNTTGAGNVAVGAGALQNNQTGGDNVAVGAGGLGTAVADSSNTVIGISALQMNNGGGQNTAIGGSVAQFSSTIANSVIIGYKAGFALTTGNNNTIISFQENTITSGSNNIAIGSQVGVNSATASNQLVIGNYIYGTGLSGTGSTISTAKIGLGVKAPAQQLDVNGGIQANDATAFIYAAAALNNGAGTGAGTITTAPTNGNPTKWIPINDAGVTRFIPAW